MSFILIGCQSSDNNGDSNVDISKVSISNSNGLGKINTVDFLVVYEDEEIIEIFEKAISNAVKSLGEVEMIEPEFDLEVIYNDGNKQGYHLLVGEKGQKSTLMKTDDINTIYTVSEEITDKFIEYVIWERY